MEVSELRSTARRNRFGDMLWRSTARHPAKLAVVYKDSRLSYGDLDERVNRTANALISRGLSKGDRVALLSHNNLAYVILRFALARAGAILVPINFMLNAAEIAYILHHGEITTVIAEDALVPVAEDAIAQSGADVRLKGIIADGGAPAPAAWEDVENWFGHPDQTEPELSIGDDEPVQILYTSGTESRPKGAMLTTRNLYTNAATIALDGGMSSDDVDIHALPLFHCGPLDAFLTPDIYLGATSIVLPGADPGEILRTIESEKASKLFCPPTVWIALMQHPDFPKRDLSSLAKGYYGAAIMPMEVLKELSERLPHVALYNLYGQTEMSPVATILGPREQLSKLGSAGRPAVNVETLIVDDEDRPLPAGEVGEIVHRGPHVMLGYWRDEEKTAETFRNGWFHSGDLGVMDEDGYLTVVDRKKDMIKTGGENVASREVEEVIFQHPDIEEVAVFGIPHPRWIEAVVAAAVIKPGRSVEPDALQAFCRERLAGYKVPKNFFIESSLPKNATGKILKRELRNVHVSRFAAGAD